MDQPEQLYREIETLRERLSRLSEASLRINESLDFDQVLQGALDSARSLTGARYGVMTLLDDAGPVSPHPRSINHNAIALPSCTPGNSSPGIW